MGTMFPGPGDTVYRNEAGEVTGWDRNDYEPEYFDCCGVAGRCACDDGSDDECDGEHAWVIITEPEGLTFVEDKDLDKVREQCRWWKLRGPHCHYCGADYDPAVHGEPLEN